MVHLVSHEPKINEVQLPAKDSARLYYTNNSAHDSHMSLWTTRPREVVLISAHRFSMQDVLREVFNLDQSIPLLCYHGQIALPCCS